MGMMGLFHLAGASCHPLAFQQNQRDLDRETYWKSNHSNGDDLTSEFCF